MKTKDSPVAPAQQAVGKVQIKQAELSVIAAKTAAKRAKLGLKRAKKIARQAKKRLRTAKKEYKVLYKKFRQGEKKTVHVKAKASPHQNAPKSHKRPKARKRLAQTRTLMPRIKRDTKNPQNVSDKPSGVKQRRLPQSNQPEASGFSQPAETSHAAVEPAAKSVLSPSATQPVGHS